ncbi:hypothetical protein CF319_g4308 [Tilletia indica]|uniref:DNA-directed RNA polymerase I subunit RPA49 n=1 Tax=Tilletia indica TaxID=43049 RepID=A0A177TM08_9BASI|nr:hypothetical protein CF319_g4308 [Tilletia indica]KAE8256043.1 hypothetical protein A4X13_0g2836 [Tilletia indica]
MADTASGSSQQRRRSSSNAGEGSSKKRKSLPHSADKNDANDSRGHADSSPAKKLKSALKASSSSSPAKQKAGQATLKLAPSFQSGQYAAALTSSAGFELPEDISFSAEVVNLSRGNNGSSGSKQRARAGDEAALYLSGQDDVMFYRNTNWRPKPLTPEGKRPPADKGYSGQYLVGVRDPTTNTITLHRAPMFTMTRLITSLENLNSIKDEDLGASADWSARVAARRDLGDAFGTKKAKATVRAQDRLKVDASNMTSMLDEVAEGINESAAILPSVEAITEIEAKGKPGPIPNMAATTPAEVYAPNTLIPPSILNSLPIQRLIKSEDEASMRKVLPHPGPPHSDWIASRMWALVKRINANSANGEGGILRTNRDDARVKLRMAVYLALLWAFRKNRGVLDDKPTLMGKLRIDGAANGELIVDDLLSRFAETPRGGGKPILTTASETRIFTHICALALHLDDYAVDPHDLALALNIQSAKMIDYFKSIGCTASDVSVPVATPSSNALESSSASIRKERRLVLKLPLKFPQNKRRAPPKAR